MALQGFYTWVHMSHSCLFQGCQGSLSLSSFCTSSCKREYGRVPFLQTTVKRVIVQMTCQLQKPQVSILPQVFVMGSLHRSRKWCSEQIPGTSEAHGVLRQALPSHVHLPAATRRAQASHEVLHRRFWDVRRRPSVVEAVLDFPLASLLRDKHTVHLEGRILE